MQKTCCGTDETAGNISAGENDNKDLGSYEQEIKKKYTWSLL